MKLIISTKCSIDNELIYPTLFNHYRFFIRAQMRPSPLHFLPLHLLKRHEKKGYILWKIFNVLQFPCLPFIHFNHSFTFLSYALNSPSKILVNLHARTQDGNS